MIAGMSDAPNVPTEKTPPTTIAKRVLLVLVLAYLVALVAMNTDEVRVNFVFFEARTPLVVALVLAGVLGAIVGWALSIARRRRGRD
jgi:uncharacterized integral membrane protein